MNNQNQQNVASGSEPCDQWEKPSFHRIGANEAENGILTGPEILILLS